MLSRVANSIYWMARYLERMDNIARFLDVNAQLMLDRGAEYLQWEPLVQVTGDDDAFNARYDTATEENVLHFLTFDEDNPNSILSCVSKARENARTVREVIASEVWEMINDLYHTVREHSSDTQRMQDLQGFYLRVKEASYLLTGLTQSTMSHTEAWHFMRMGQMLERADKTARLLDVKYFLLLPDNERIDSLYDAVEWGAVLKSANAFETYRKQFHKINYRNVTEFLIFDGHFPRSIVQCVASAAQSLDAITVILGKPSVANVHMLALQTLLSNASVDSVLNDGLHQFVDVFQYQLNIVDQTIYESFFALKDVVIPLPYQAQSQ